MQIASVNPPYPRSRTLLAAVLAVVPLAASAHRGPPPADLALSGGSYLDVRAGVFRPNGVIEIRNARIAALLRDAG